VSVHNTSAPALHVAPALTDRIVEAGQHRPRSLVVHAASAPFTQRTDADAASD